MIEPAGGRNIARRAPAAPDLVSPTPTVRGVLDSGSDATQKSRSDALRAALARPESYPDQPDRIDVRETHTSWVFLAGDRAYKLKKPVVLPFLDYGTPERRHQMCREEVELNQRLAPDIYRRVLGVSDVNGGVTFIDEEDSRAVDYLVEMRRFDERSTLASKLRTGELKRRDIISVAKELAHFHQQALHGHMTAVPASEVERRLTTNFQELLALVEQRAELNQVLELERFAHAFVAAYGQLLNARGWNGLVREVHGDLRAEHVLLDGVPRFVDRIEFDQGLRELDVADDLAFLVMDLTANGGQRWARLLVDVYRKAGGDPGEDRLLAFYASFRALVRAKVALVRAAQSPVGSSRRGRDSAAARDLLALAERFAWQARLPLILVICGAPAAGKSRLARAIARRSGLPHLNSDLTRRRLASRHLPEELGVGLYSPEFSRLTYAELGRLAAKRTATSGGAIVDATFRHRADREAFIQATADAAPLLFVQCVAPVGVLRDRAVRRERRASVSAATLSVVEREGVVWEPLDEVAPTAHLLLRSDRPVIAQLDDLRALLDHRLDLSATGRSSRLQAVR